MATPPPLLLSTYYVPGTVMGAEYAMLNLTSVELALLKFIF